MNYLVNYRKIDTYPSDHLDKLYVLMVSQISNVSVNEIVAYIHWFIWLKIQTFSITQICLNLIGFA